ncbi:MAG: hypothetical protein IPG98_08225 [Burkholderiales bacterium]|nr:hypothetical protein [Burkholderiales bacterium]
MRLLSKLIGVIPNKTPVSTEESLWALALSEFNGLNRRPGLWAQVLAGANGDESKAQAAYLKARYDELVDEYSIAEALERARAKESAEREQVRVAAMMEIEAQAQARAQAQREARSKASIGVNADLSQTPEIRWLYPGLNNTSLDTSKKPKQQKKYPIRGVENHLVSTQWLYPNLGEITTSMKLGQWKCKDNVLVVTA